MDIVATFSSPAPGSLKKLETLPNAVRWLELRADLAGDIDADSLRGSNRRVIYSLRGAAAGGAFDGSLEERHRRLRTAAQSFDLVELEADQDLVPDVLENIPPVKRMISWYGEAPGLSKLRQKLDELFVAGAQNYKLVTRIRCIADGIDILFLLKRLARFDLVAFCSGPSGFWTQILAPLLGSRFVFGMLESTGNPSDGPTVQQLLEDYGFPAAPIPRYLYGIVGNPVLQSPTPRLHNAAYRIARQPALFLPFQVESFADFWSEMIAGKRMESLNLPLKGLIVVSPNKQLVLGLADVATPIVRRAEASNICFRRHGIWKADTTDPQGLLQPLLERGIEPRGKKAAVVGCGGAGRAIAAALQDAGAVVMLVNRGMARGMHAVQLLGLPFLPLAKFSPRGFDLVVNATPVGREGNLLPFSLDELDAGAIVVDLAYGTKATPLVKGARERGQIAIDGWEVLAAEVRSQLQIMLAPGVLRKPQIRLFPHLEMAPT